MFQWVSCDDETMVKTGIVKNRVLRNTHLSVEYPMGMPIAEGKITQIYLTVNFNFLRQQFPCLLLGCSIAAFGPTLRRWENRLEMCPTIFIHIICLFLFRIHSELFEHSEHMHVQHQYQLYIQQNPWQHIFWPKGSFHKDEK